MRGQHAGRDNCSPLVGEHLLLKGTRQDEAVRLRTCSQARMPYWRSRGCFPRQRFEVQPHGKQSCCIANAFLVLAANEGPVGRLRAVLGTRKHARTTVRQLQFAPSLLVRNFQPPIVCPRGHASHAVLWILTSALSMKQPRPWRSIAWQLPAWGPMSRMSGPACPPGWRPA